MCLTRNKPFETTIQVYAHRSFEKFLKEGTPSLLGACSLRTPIPFLCVILNKAFSPLNCVLSPCAFPVVSVFVSLLFHLFPSLHIVSALPRISRERLLRAQIWAYMFPSSVWPGCNCSFRRLPEDLLSVECS